MKLGLSNRAWRTIITKKKATAKRYLDNFVHSGRINVPLRNSGAKSNICDYYQNGWLHRAVPNSDTIATDRRQTVRCLYCLLLVLAAESTAFTQQPTPTSTADDAEKKLAVLEGRVIDAGTGEPVRKANLSLMQLPAAGTVSSGPPPTTAVTSDAEGKFSFTKLEPGTYMLSAERVGYVRQQYGSRNGQFGPGTNLTLKAGDRLSALEFRISKQAVITGRVFDEEGEPVPNAMVSVMRQLPLGHQPQMIMGNGTNDLGEFRIANLTPGKYFIRAARSGFAGSAVAAPAAEAGKPALDYVPTYYPNATDAASAAPLTVTAGQQVAGADIQLKKSRVYQVRGTLNGYSRGSRVQISAQPQVTSGSMAFGFAGGTSVKNDGTFVLPSIQPGSYNLIVMSYENGGRPSIIGRAAVVVSNDHVENVVITAGSPMTLTGRVIPAQPAQTDQAQPQGNTVTGQVTLMSLNRLPFFGGPAKVQDDGTFKLEGVPRDKVIFQIFGLPQGQYIKSVMAGSADITTGLDLTAAESAPPIEIRVSANGAAIEGTVTNTEGKPAQSAIVMLLAQPYAPDNPLSITLRKTATTDQTGHFSIKAVAPGEYRLYAWETYVNFSEVDADQLKPFESRSASVKLKEGQTANVELKLITVPE